MVAVETMESMEHNPDLAPGETTPPREEPNHCARGPAPEKKEKARRANPHLHLDHHAPSSRGVLLSAPMADVSPPPPARPRRWTGVQRETNHLFCHVQSNSSLGNCAMTPSIERGLVIHLDRTAMMTSLERAISEDRLFLCHR
jgi:hypothetical protein